MAKSKHSKPDEFYLGKIRNLTKEITALKRRIKQLERLEYNYFNKRDPEEKVPEQKQKKMPLCESCREGVLETLTIAGRLIDKCNYCDYRSGAKKVDKE